MKARPRVRSITPLLVVADLQRAIDFYCNKLGFAEPRVHGEPPCFAMINRNGFELMLSLAGDAESIRPNGPNGVWDMYICVDHIADEIEAITAAGATIESGPRDMPYQMREIEIVDPEGYRICLAEDISSPDEIWNGALQIAGKTLRIVLKVSRNDGEYTAKLDSLDQNAYGLAIDSISFDDDSLLFSMNAIGASFKGRLDQDRKEYPGEWTQRGQAWPLTLRREKD